MTNRGPAVSICWLCCRCMWDNHQSFLPSTRKRSSSSRARSTSSLSPRRSSPHLPRDDDIQFEVEFWLPSNLICLLIFARLPSQLRSYIKQTHLIPTGFSSKSYMQSQMGSLLWLFLYFTIFVYKLNKVDWKIRSLTATERNCYFSGEGKLEFYEVYSYDNCVLECKIKTNQHKFNCTPWFLPHRFNWVKNLNLLINKIFSQKYGTVCDPWKGKEFMILFDKTSTGLETKRFCKFWWQGWLAVKS